jgi:hypothetical protein
MTKKLEQTIDDLDLVLALVRAEALKAISKHGPMHSPHEGMSIIREEVDELWDHVKADTGQTPDAYKEAVQIAAMGVRYLVDLGGCDHD